MKKIFILFILIIMITIGNAKSFMWFGKKKIQLMEAMQQNNANVAKMDNKIDALAKVTADIKMDIDANTTANLGLINKTLNETTNKNIKTGDNAKISENDTGLMKTAIIYKELVFLIFIIFVMIAQMIRSSNQGKRIEAKDEMIHELNERQYDLINKLVNAIDADDKMVNKELATRIYK